MISQVELLIIQNHFSMSQTDNNLSQRTLELPWNFLALPNTRQHHRYRLCCSARVRVMQTGYCWIEHAVSRQTTKEFLCKKKIELVN